MNRELVERARRGDPEAFSAATAEALPGLYGVATLVLRDPALAQDAVQDGLLDAWRGIRALREVNAWDAWLRRCVVRACYRHQRREGRARTTASRYAAAEVHQEDPMHALARRDQLARGFDDLSTNHRAVVVLHFYLDLPLEEISETLGVPVGTVKSRLHRATQLLRARLDADERRPVREIHEL